MNALFFVDWPRFVAAAIVLGFVLALNYIGVRRRWRYADGDKGGYIVRLANRALYWKAGVHGLAGYFVADLLLHGHVGGVLAVLLLMAVVAVLFEKTQGFMNRYDIIGGITGAALAVVIHWPR